MAAESVFVMWVSLLVFAGTAFSASQPDPLIRITDGNWRQVLEGEWMVEFMAPWCPACRGLQSTWQSFAEWSRDLEIKVGVVDVTQNPGLSGRFLVTSLPTIFHIKDGEFRLFQGERKENEFLSFVDDKKWQQVAPVSSWTHPNSIQMGIVGFFFRCAMVIRGFYSTLTTEYGIPEWGCYLIFAVATILTGLLLGLIFVLCCDWLFPVKYMPSQTIPPRATGDEYKDKDDESDLLDDTDRPMPEAGPSEGGDTSVRKRQMQGGNSSPSTGDTTASSS